MSTELEEQLEKTGHRTRVASRVSMFDDVYLRKKF